MGYVKTKDNVEIFYKDWGNKEDPVIFFHHGFPLTSDDWDTEMLFFSLNGYRVVASDRRGHGRSEQVGDGHDMDHYADDVKAVLDHLGIKKAAHIGHSTGGGVIVRFISRHGEDQVTKAILVSAVPPVLVQKDTNPEGTPMAVFDGYRKGLLTNRGELYHEVTTGGFYGYNRPGAKPEKGTMLNWWRMAMQGGIKAEYDGIKAFSETDFTEELKKIQLPMLVLHGDDDQMVPLPTSGKLTAQYVKNSKLIVYKGAPHGIPTTHADQINKDVLEFLKE